MESTGTPPRDTTTSRVYSSGIYLVDDPRSAIDRLASHTHATSFDGDDVSTGIAPRSCRDRAEIMHVTATSHRSPSRWSMRRHSFAPPKRARCVQPPNHPTLRLTMPPGVDPYADDEQLSVARLLLDRRAEVDRPCFAERLTPL